MSRFFCKVGKVWFLGLGKDACFENISKGKLRQDGAVIAIFGIGIKTCDVLPSAPTLG